MQKSNKKGSKKARDSKKHRKDEQLLKDSDISENGQKSKVKKNKHDMNGNTEEVDGPQEDKKKRKRKRREDDDEDGGMNYFVFLPVVLILLYDIVFQ